MAQIGTEVDRVAEQPVESAPDRMDLADQIDTLMGITDPGAEPEPEPSAPVLETGGSASPDEPVDEPEPETIDEPEPIAVDYDAMVPMPDGREPIKLGDMKDKLTEYERNEDTRIERDTRHMAQVREFQEIMTAVGVIPPQLKEIANGMHQEHLVREHSLMIEAIPEMADKAGFEKVTTAVRQVMTDYGATTQEIAQVSDSRFVLMLRDLAGYRARDQEARASYTKTPRKKVAQGRKPIKTKQSDIDRIVDAAKISRSDSVKTDAIDKLMQG